MYVDDQDYLPLNGAGQYVSIQARRENAPLLLYLHGGPGDAALPLVMKYNCALTEHFTLAVWEQRGAGKSYYPFRPEDGITIDLFLEDLLQLVRHLLARFRQERIILVGHSWGSVLGLRFTAEHPELVRAYVGCGQVVNMKKSCRAAYDFALAHAGPEAAQRLEGIDCAYTGEGWLEDLLFVTGQVVKHRGSLYGKSSYTSLILPFLSSRYYSIADLIKRQKGGLQSIQFLWQELMGTDFEGRTRYEVPVFFVEGRHDSHVSAALAKGYFDTLQSEKQFFWFEQSCHFPQWSEHQRFHQLLFDLFSKPS